MEFNKLLKESQFHGGRRLLEQKCRWYWYISLALLFGCAVAVVHVTVQRYHQNPTFMVKLESVANLSLFPTISVCPEIFYGEEQVDQFLTPLQIPPHLNRTYLKAVMNNLAAYYSPDVIYRMHDLKNIEDLLNHNNIQVKDAAKALTTSCEDTLIRCRWHGKLVNCSNLFMMELTGDGYCCVFNGRSLAGQYYGHRHGVPTYEYKSYSTFRYGYTSGIMIAVNQSQIAASVDLSYKWLAIQTPGHFVESTINGSALSPGTEVWAEYQPHNFQIADEARGLSHSLRKCRMGNEVLKYFPVYNQRYCGVECELAHTLKKCGCIRLVHPPVSRAPVCSSLQLQCAKLAMVSYDSEVCQCPSSCDVAKDTVKVSSYWLDPLVPSIDTFYDGLNFSKTTTIRVFIRNSLTITDSRASYFSNFDLFSQLGGVFNVFFGCSVLSLLELTFLACRGSLSITHRLGKKRADRAKRDAKEAGFKDLKV